MSETKQSSSNELPKVQVDADSGIHIEDKAEKIPDDKPRKVRQLRHSNYYITFNTNKRYTGYEEVFEQKCKELEDAILYVFNNPKPELIVFREGGPADIKTLGLEYGIELAPNTNCLHCHMTFKIAHYAKISLDFDYINKAVASQLGLDKVYMFSRMYRDSGANLKNYMQKNKTQQNQ